MQEKCSQLENSKMELEKQLMGLQAELEKEKRDRSLRTETITDLQGETRLITAGVEKNSKVVFKATFEERNNL